MFIQFVARRPVHDGNFAVLIAIMRRQQVKQPAACLAEPGVWRQQPAQAGKPEPTVLSALGDWRRIGGSQDPGDYM